MKTVSVILTVRNDAGGCAVTLESLAGQTRAPDEIVVVDGGSSDDTVAAMRRIARGNPRIRVIESDGRNIAQGRNFAARLATGEILACIDAGCRANSDWLERLTCPFELDPETDFVAGFYRIQPESLLETVIGLATMRGQLDAVDPESFNPSARSMACTKELWQRASGWPEWLHFSEDTLFDRKVRRLHARWRVAMDAVVHWRPRSTLRAVARQFFNYGTGRGHTQIGARSSAYNLRNVGICLATASLCGIVPWAALPLAAMLLYFYVWTFHDRALRIARSTGRWRAYPLCLLVMWVVLFAHLAGYLLGSWQRRRDRDRYQRGMEVYLATS